jgi:signal transduction histidine kinase
MMPNLTGTELCAAIKKSQSLKSTPVVMLTARGGAESALDGFASGADEFVEKPFHPRVLVARVSAQLRLKALTLQLATQARLAAVGSLAAGVGHEVRNPVNAVLNGVRVLLEHETTTPETKALLDVIAEGAERIERISGALLGHARPGDQGGAKPIDVREGLDATLKLLDFRLGGVEVQKEYGTSAKVVASAAELNQVFLNLLDNGLRAPAKTLWLRVMDAGQTVRVAVEDDGPGVPPEHQARIFDAFYTTRQPGQGTGLGLYLSQQLVQKWGGSLTFHPREGGGASFVVELPKEAV